MKVTGIAYIKNGYRYPIPNRILKKAELYQSPFHKTMRFIIGFIHMLAAFILVGAIFYIHIFIKPSQITGGIPKGERILGLSCLSILTVTGIYLTWFRIDLFEQFFNNTFGLIMNNDIERTTGCYNCHGTVVKVKNGKPIEGTWPNVGVGRQNPDGNLGSCSSCHTRHKFSMQEARKPEACDQCHLGPDHPQIEIYNESKHGTIYHAEGDAWNWAPDDGKWQAGRDFRAPTCATCHMSAVGGGVVLTSHDVTERLSWELQAPLTVRPSEFKAFQAATGWERERSKMGLVCMPCHSETWRNDHFSNLDKVIRNYNEIYYTPAKQTMDTLYQEKLLSKASYFDEDLEWEFYELWHYEGRRARMGAAMMAPDYAWWHGFYELKHRFVHFMDAAEKIKQTKKSEMYPHFPGKSAGSEKPD